MYILAVKEAIKRFKRPFYSLRFVGFLFILYIKYC